MFESVGKFGASTGLSTRLWNLKQIRTSFFSRAALSVGWMEQSGTAVFWSKRGQLRNGTTCPLRGRSRSQSAARKLRLGYR